MRPLRSRPHATTDLRIVYRRSETRSEQVERIARQRLLAARGLADVPARAWVRPMKLAVWSMLLVVLTLSASRLVVSGGVRGGAVFSARVSNAAGCATATPNVPDGPDPWGGCWPGLSNTGVPTGTTLTTYTGSCTVTSPATIVAKTVNCFSSDLVIAAGGCGTTITDSYVNGQVYTDGSGGTDKTCVTVTDSTLDPGPLPEAPGDGRGIGTRNFTAIRVETVRGKSGGWCEYYCLVQDSYMHAQDRDESGAAHESGIRQGSGTTTHAQEIFHNAIFCEAPEVLPDAGCSASVTGYGDFDTIQNNYVHRNLIGASPTSTGGGYCAYGGASPKPFPLAANQLWVENVFQKGISGHCGVFGAATDFAVGVRGNTFTGNTWDDGTAFSTPDS